MSKKLVIVAGVLLLFLTACSSGNDKSSTPSAQGDRGEPTAIAATAALSPAPTAPPTPSTATPVPPTAIREPPSSMPWAPIATAIPETQPLPPPQDLGPEQAAGLALVTISNDGPNTLTIEFHGPDSTTISFPPCPTCAKYNVAPASCPEERYREVLRLKPGVYTVSVRADDPSVMPLAGTWDLHANTAYLGCWFSVDVHASG